MRHALQALGEFSAARGRALGIGEVARRLGLPPAALSKSFQRLARAGLLRSRRGPGGGYELAREPARVRLSEVADALEVPASEAPRCLLEDRPCGAGGTCALHKATALADEGLREALDSLTLAALARAGSRR